MTQEWSPGSFGHEAGEGKWAGHLRRLIDEGQCFLAYDYAQEALKGHPESRRIRLLAALALVRSGAASEARRMFAPIEEQIDSREPLARSIIAGLQRLLPSLSSADPLASSDIKSFARLASDLIKLGGSEGSVGTDDSEILRLRADYYFDTWRAAGLDEDLRRSRDTYLQNFQFHADLDSGVRAAVTSWLLRDDKLAEEIADELLRHPRLEELPVAGVERFERLVTLGEIYLLRGAADQALACYREAGGLPGIGYPPMVAARERLALLVENGLAIPQELFDCLRLPVVVVFSGQPLDPPGQSQAIFPAHLEDTVKREIRRRLDELDAEIGYCSAASGSDLLFVEAMLERGGEVHLYLPCSVDDFVAARVAYAGKQWEQRFHTALKLAATVNFATGESYLGHDILFRFNNQIIDGMARLRSELLGTNPHLMLVWDYTVESRAGTAADFMDHWADIARLRLIDLDDIRTSTPQPQGQPVDEEPVSRHAPIVPQEPERVIKAMLFADIVGFSKLREEELPGLWRFLDKIRALAEARCCVPDLIESWGDALYVVMPTARSMLDYAFLLQEAFGAMSADDYNLSAPLQLRVGLHAGPVYEGFHPLTGKAIIYGSHVSRTARIEPVTVPGQIYGSQQFVALLTAEESVLLHEREMTGENYNSWFACDYLGNQPLAKKYGSQPVYHLRPAIGKTYGKP